MSFYEKWTMKKNIKIANDLLKIYNILDVEYNKCKTNKEREVFHKIHDSMLSIRSVLESKLFNEHSAKYSQLTRMFFGGMEGSSNLEDTRTMSLFKKLDYVE